MLDEIKLKETIDDLIIKEGWSTDEMIELLGECEFALSHFSGRIEELKARGLKRLYNIITGINRRNKIKVLDDLRLIQEISFGIEKILMKRIDLVSSALINLNDKLNTKIFWTVDTINSLNYKLSNIDITTRLLFWQNNVKNKKTKFGKKYIEVSNGIKILLTASDLFDIIHSVDFFVDRPFWETTLENLGLQDQINIADFYEDIINERKYLSLYIKSEYYYKSGNISDYGYTIYKIADFYQDKYMIEEAEKRKKSMDDLCREAYVDKFRREGIRINPTDLCRMLLEDLQEMYFVYQRRLGETKENDMKKIETSGKEKGPMISQDENTKKEYSILRLTPEGTWLFKNSDVCYSKKEHKSDYSFKKEEENKEYLDKIRPYAIATPSGYFDQCLPEIKHVLSLKTRYIPLADYYMYLWFHNTGIEVRKNKKVAFIEYYAHNLYVSGYTVETSGENYKKGFSHLMISYKKIKNNIKSPIMSQKVFLGLNWEDILIFKVFTAEKYIDEKLEDMGVHMVDSIWENVLLTNNDELGRIIQKIIDKSEEK